MPKKFTDKEKVIIKKSLIKTGKEHFSIYGLQKTSITDLTKSVGIAQGSFYNFFNSKEELYFEILENEEAETEEYLQNIISSTDSAKEAINETIKATYILFEKNKFLRRIYSSNDYDIMIRKISEDKIKNHQKGDTQRVLNTIISAQKDYEHINASPEIIAGLFRGITILNFHQDEIGSDLFPEVIELLAEVIAEGLVKKETTK
jgi:AcrR family transcriptional regulator